jgi:hypothetical protein
VVAAAAFWRRSPVDSNRAAAKAAPCKILLRITANLTNALVAKIAPQQAATPTHFVNNIKYSHKDRLALPGFLLLGVSELTIADLGAR